MIIDSHQHFWNYDAVRDAWIDDHMQVLKRDFLPKDYDPILQEHQIAGCIAVQADQSEEETLFLLDCATKHPFIKGVVGWVDLCASNVAERLEYFAQNPLFKGVRHIVQAEDDDYLLRKTVQNGIACLSQFNLTFDLLIYPRQLPAAIALVAQFPQQKFILNHIAKPHISAPLSENWTTQISLLAQNLNVYCKLSGMVTETTNYQFEEAQFRPYLDVVFQCFGAQRLLFGSDWPVCLLAADYRGVLEIVKNYFEEYPKDIKEQIMGLNAIKIYNL